MWTIYGTGFRTFIPLPPFKIPKEQEALDLPCTENSYQHKE